MYSLRTWILFARNRMGMQQHTTHYTPDNRLIITFSYFPTKLTGYYMPPLLSVSLCVYVCTAPHRYAHRKWCIYRSGFADAMHTIKCALFKAHLATIHQMTENTSAKTRDLSHIITIRNDCIFIVCKCLNVDATSCTIPSLSIATLSPHRCNINRN